jgi:hypothetical protein
MSCIDLLLCLFYLFGSGCGACGYKNMSYVNVFFATIHGFFDHCIDAGFIVHITFGHLAAESSEFCFLIGQGIEFLVERGLYFDLEPCVEVEVFPVGFFVGGCFCIVFIISFKKFIFGYRPGTIGE